MSYRYLYVEDTLFKVNFDEISKNVCFVRICMMINWLLKNLGLHAEIDEVLYKKIHDNMMERMQDKVAEIRAQAVTALQRLQVSSLHWY